MGCQEGQRNQEIEPESTATVVSTRHGSEGGGRSRSWAGANSLFNSLLLLLFQVPLPLSGTRSMGARARLATTGPTIRHSLWFDFPHIRLSPRLNKDEPEVSSVEQPSRSGTLRETPIG